MAEELDKDSVLTADIEPLDLIKTKLKRTQNLLLMVTGLLVVTLLLSGASLFLALRSGQQLSAANAQMEVVTTRLEQGQHEATIELARLGEVSLQNTTGLSSLNTQVSRIDVNDNDNIIVRLQRILIRQERDYRDFLNNLERGLNDVHMMVPHSRGWWERFNEKHKEVYSLSEARENYIVNIREN